MATTHGSRPQPGATTLGRFCKRTAWVGRVTPLRRFVRTETGGAMPGGRADPAAAEPAPPELIGIHTNLGGVIPLELFSASFIRHSGAVRSLRRGAEYLR